MSYMLTLMLQFIEMLAEILVGSESGRGSFTLRVGT